MQVPKWAKCYFEDSDLQEIEKVLAEVEQHTSGEIVPVIVSRSSAIGHVPLVWWLLGLLVLLSADSGYSMMYEQHLPWWGLLIGFVSLSVLTGILARMDWAKRILITPEDRRHQAELRAEVEFFEAGLNKTDGSTGILLFVSLLEHQAVVLADKGIASKLPPSIWNQVVALLVNGVRQENIKQGLLAAVRECGAILKLHFPAQTNNRNELPNKLILKE